LVLAQAAIYVACAPKSNAGTVAISKAAADVQNEPIRPVPMHLKDSHYAAAKKAGFGAQYKYPHNYENGFVAQEYLPGPPKSYYVPKNAGYEKNIAGHLQRLRSLIDNDKESKNARTDGTQGPVDGQS
jgi:putative ATPase